MKHDTLEALTGIDDLRKLLPNDKKADKLYEVVQQVQAELESCELASKVTGEGFTVYRNDLPILEIKYLSNTPAPHIETAFRSMVGLTIQAATDSAVDLLKESTSTENFEELVSQFKGSLEGSLAMAAGAFKSVNNSKGGPLDPTDAPLQYLTTLIGQTHQYVRDKLPGAVEALLDQLYAEAMLSILKPGQVAVKRGLKTLDSFQRDALRHRLQTPGRGREAMIQAREQKIALALEYARLTTDRTFGDNADKTLWEIVCHRFDQRDPKWRERAKLDDENIPGVVLDLVPERKRFKLKLSHLALYDAATRTGIEFQEKQRTNGKRFLEPSRATLQRCCDEGNAEIKAEYAKPRARKATV